MQRRCGRALTSGSAKRRWLVLDRWPVPGSEPTSCALAGRRARRLRAARSRSPGRPAEPSSVAGLFGQDYGGLLRCVPAADRGAGRACMSRTRREAVTDRASGGMVTLGLGTASGPGSATTRFAALMPTAMILWASTSLPQPTSRRRSSPVSLARDRPGLAHVKLYDGASGKPHCTCHRSWKRSY